MDISSQVSEISVALNKAWGFQRVVIGHDERSFRCQIHTSIWYLFPERLLFCLSSWVPEWFRAENRETIDYFYRVFGQRRIDRISKRFELRLAERHDQGLSLTRRDVEKIFVGLGDVHLEDVQDLFEKVVQNSTDAKLGDTEEAARRKLHERFRRREFATLTKEEYDALYRHLIPFETVEDLFLGNVPTFNFWRKFARQYEVTRQRVYACEKLRSEGADFDEIVWDYRIAKTFLGNTQQEPGVLIPHPRGYYAYWGKVNGGGACISLFKALQEGIDSIVKGHGTRTNLFSSRDARLSLIDDFSEEIGSRGVAAIQETLLWILGRRPGEAPHTLERQYEGMDPRLFGRAGIRRGSEKFKGVAFSLGVANLSLVAYRHQDLFSELTLTCGPGISEKKCREWQVIRHGPRFRIIIEIDDLVHRAGGAHLAQWMVEDGAGIELVVFAPVFMTKVEVRALLLNPPSLPESIWELFVVFFKGFGRAHSRDTTIQQLFSYHRFSIQEDENDVEVIHHVLQDREWERARRYVRARAVDAERRANALRKAVGSHVSWYLTIRDRPTGNELA